jgi:hypothetical protein
MGRAPRAGVWSQMLYASRYGVAVGLMVVAAWLLLALVSKQWTQISVFTLGLAVPWALYNATTRRKYLGLRVWIEPPPLIFMSTASFVIVMALTLAMEYLARLLIFGNKFPAADFAQRYFRASDWVILVCGLALAALTPFLLKFGAELSAPWLRKRSKAEGEEQQETDRLDKELREELAKEPGEQPCKLYGDEFDQVSGAEPYQQSGYEPEHPPGNNLESSDEDGRDVD